MALSWLSCLSRVSYLLYPALRLLFPQVSCHFLLVVVWSWVPGWLHRFDPVLILELLHLHLHLPLLVHEYRSFIPVDDPGGLFLALGLDLVLRVCLGDDLLARLPELGGGADVPVVLLLVEVVPLGLGLVHVPSPRAIGLVRALPPRSLGLVHTLTPRALILNHTLTLVPLALYVPWRPVPSSLFLP